MDSKIVLEKVLYLFKLLTSKGISLIVEVPPGKPLLIPPLPLSAESVKDLTFFYDQLQPESVEWWDKWLTDRPLPSIVLPESNIFCWLYC